MKIEEVFRTINQMRNDAVIERYGVGGAVGATFYLEPVSTLDVDIFIQLHTAPGSLIISLDPIFSYLRDLGCEMEGEHIVIGGWPIQFVPPTSPLAEEALNEATEMNVGDVSVCVFTAEHLAALALQTGRAKDKARLLQFIENGALDEGRFQAIVNRHGLQNLWQIFQRQFLSEN